MTKVKIASKLDHEWIANFKALQEGFKKLQVDKVCNYNNAFTWSPLVIILIAPLCVFY